MPSKANTNTNPRRRDGTYKYHARQESIFFGTGTALGVCTRCGLLRASVARSGNVPHVFYIRDPRELLRTGYCMLKTAAGRCRGRLGPRLKKMPRVKANR